MKPVNKFLKVALISSAVAAAFPTSVLADNAVLQQQHQLQIVAMPLHEALATFSKQTDLVVLAPSELIADKTSSAVNGNFTVQEMLERILLATGLEARFENGAIIIYQPDAPEVPESSLIRPSFDNAPDAELMVEVVSKGFRGSLASSLAQKQNANQFIDAITAEDVGLFPDQNVAEAIARISGVSLTRNNGEGEFVTIRGLDPTFTRVEVNGRSTFLTSDSSDPERAAVLSGISSELFQNIEVVKSPTAKDDEGGLGGIVRLSSPKPLDVGERKIGFQAGVSSSEFKDDSQPSISGFFADVFADERVGILFSANYEKQDRRIDRVQNTDNWLEVDEGMLANPDDPEAQALVGSYYAGAIRQEARWGESPRYNINMAIQARPTDMLELYADLIHINESRDENFSRIESEFRRGELLSGTVDPATNTLVEGTFQDHRVDFSSFTRDIDLETTGVTLGADWTSGFWSIGGKLSISESEEDRLQGRVRARVGKDDLGSYNVAINENFPSFTTTAANLSAEDVSVREMDWQRRIIAIDETSVQLDIERDIQFGPFTAIYGGVKNRLTEFTRRQGSTKGPTEFDFDGDGEAEDITYANGDPNFFVDDYGFGLGSEGFLNSWVSADPLSFLQQFNVPSNNIEFNDTNRYDIEEDNLALYFMADYEADIGKYYVRGNVGLRHVKTDSQGDGALEIDGELQEGNVANLDGSTTNTLPSFNLILSEGSEANLLYRFAVAKGMTLPTIDEIRPVVEIDNEEARVSRGNPELDPFLAWQYDFSLEYYFGEQSEGLASIGFFYKDVQNFIAETSYLQSGTEIEGATLDEDYLVSSFRNAGEAEAQGVELSFQTPFTFLPGFWQNFGTMMNYTYTDSVFKDIDGTERSFLGASKDTYNIALYYETDELSTRLSYNYRSDYLDETAATDADGDGFNDTNAIYGAGAGRLDFAFRYYFQNGWRLSFDVLNVTETRGHEYYDVSNRLRDSETEGRIYSLTASTSF